MNDTENTITHFLAGLVVGITVCMGLTIFGAFRNGHKTTEHTDTVTVCKTIVRTAPDVAKERIKGYEPVTIPLVMMDGQNKRFSEKLTKSVNTDSAGTSEKNLTKSVNFSDSITVQLPVGQRTYEDSLYTAYVSGYRLNDYPRLDSIHIRQRTQYVTKTVMQYAKRKNWSLSVGVGMSWNGKDVRPGIQATVGYRILEF